MGTKCQTQLGPLLLAWSHARVSEYPSHYCAEWPTSVCSRYMQRIPSSTIFPEGLCCVWPGIQNRKCWEGGVDSSGIIWRQKCKKTLGTISGHACTTWISDPVWLTQISGCDRHRKGTVHPIMITSYYTWTMP